MSTTTVPAEPSFQLSQLWTDSRYRSYTIQALALLGCMAVAAILVSNAVANLEALGKDISFGFLGETAGYDIDQRLIEYSSSSLHWEAALVGILNTLLVSLLACIAATMIGVIAGVLRLSNNWVVSRLMTVYIEGVRNVPLLLQILAWYAIFIHAFPTPRQAVKAPVIEGAVYATNRGFYIPSLTFSSGYLIVLAVLAVSVAGVVYFRSWARKRQEATGQILPLGLLSIAILVVPAVVVYFLAGSPIGFEYPQASRFNLQGGLKIGSPLVALWFALSIYTGAFIAEIVRAGIMAISKGQTEAAYALGLRPNRTMSLVILPQARRVIIPPMISMYLNITKNSSLAIAVGYSDVTATLGGITLNQTGREMECVLLLMAFYLTASLSISSVMNVYNNSVKLKGR